MSAQAVAIEIPVAWGEMDSFGHVNNIVYLRWFESVRMALFERVGIVPRDAGQTCGPILARTSCNFVHPVVYPDTVTAHATLSRIGTKSFTMAYRVDSQALGATAAQGDGTIVWYDYAVNASTAIPDELRARLQPYVLQPES